MVNGPEDPPYDLDYELTIDWQAQRGAGTATTATDLQGDPKRRRTTSGYAICRN